ncbi:MAG TPA: pitrilysin family protein [Vicinamibacterales bacterium]|jgi:zinc protease
MATDDPVAARALRTFVLDNGLKVFVQEVHTAPLASVWCWYKVGSRDETAGLTGVSHWVEHMNFKGTTNIPREKVKGIIEEFGGSWNGYTWIDQTTYLETATREALDRMIFIEAERMANGLYEPEECESERTVIISELDGGENDPDQLLEMEVNAAAFKAHPYGHPTIGWKSDLKRMSREDLYGYYRRYYVPNNATLVVVGDVDPEDVMQRVRHHFGSIAPGTLPPRILTPEPPQLGERRVTVEKQGTTAYLKLAYHAPAAHEEAFVPMLLVDAVLTGAKGINLWSSFRTPPPQRSARLYRSLVEGRLASTVSGAMLATADPYLYSISITARDGAGLDQVEQAAAAEIDRTRRDGVTAAELEKARNQLRARMVFENDSVTNIAHQLGYFETISSVDMFLSMAERIRQVTLDQVNEAAATCLRPTCRTVGWFKPSEIDGPR